MSTTRILAIALAMICSGIIPVLAYMYYWETNRTYIESGVKIIAYTTPTLQFGIYSDPACTQPVTTIDFGEMVHPQTGQTLGKRMYIRNEGDAWLTMYWNSTLHLVTTEITEYWNNLNNASTTIIPGSVLSVDYRIYIPAYATTGTFNWTLTIWGAHYY